MKPLLLKLKEGRTKRDAEICAVIHNILQEYTLQHDMSIAEVIGILDLVKHDCRRFTEYKGVEP